LSLKRAVFQIFDFKNAVTLKTGLLVRRGHWKYYHSIERIDFLLTFYSNYSSISCRFWDTQYRKMSWPWNRVRGYL